MSNHLPENTRRFPVADAPYDDPAHADAPYADATVAPYLMRPVFFIVTMVLLVSAIGQLGGRLLFANLHHLEPRINEWLAPQGVVITELSGDWRFFNPVLKVGSGAAPGVGFGASWAEIDTLESLARNRVVLRNAQVSDLRLTLSQDDAGVWSLDGRVPRESTFDWQSLLWHSDQLKLQANLALLGYELPASELVLRAEFTNFGGRHRGDVVLANAAGCLTETAVAVTPGAEGCALRARYNVEESALWFRERSGGALLSATDFYLRGSAAALAGLDALDIGTLDARLRLLRERFSGPVNVLNSGLTLPGGKPVRLNLLAEGWALDDGSVARLALSALQLQNEQDTLEVRDAKINWNAPTGVLLRVPEVRVDDITALTSHMLSPDIPTAMWIKRLGMTGRFTRLLASWSADAGLGFGGDFDQVAMRSFRGVPRVVDLEGSFTGGPRYLQLRMNDSPAMVGFPELYREDREYSSVTGEVLLYFGQDYFGLEGGNLRFVDADMTTTGSFSLVSTKPLTNNHITLALQSDAGEFSDLEPYVPYKLPQNVLDWLDESGLKADLTAPRFVMHGPLREEESDMKRSYLIEALMQDGSMVFNPEWPRITRANGRVRVSHVSINAELESAELSGLALQDMYIRLPSGSASVAAQGTAVFDASQGLNFIRSTPLRTSMDFVADDWWAKGQMRLNVDLALPLDGTQTSELDPRVQVQIEGALQNTTFGLPEAGLVFADLRGPLRYSYPYDLSGSNISGTLFGRSMTLDVSTHDTASAPAGSPDRFAPSRIDFAMTGSMQASDMWPLLNMDPSDVVSGAFDFHAIYSTETDRSGGGRVDPTLLVETDLLGAVVNLPAPFGKPASAPGGTEATVNFGVERTRANLIYKGLLNADLGIEAEGISGGHLHLFDASAPAERRSDVAHTLARWDGVSGPIVVDGLLSSADVAQWSAGDGAVELPPYIIDNVQIGVAQLGDFEIPQVSLSGTSDAEQLVLDFDSETAAGELRVPTEGTTQLTLRRFVYADSQTPAAAAELSNLVEGSVGDDVSASVSADVISAAQGSVSEPTVDPVSPELMASLQDMDVVIESLNVDGEDYGRWGFQIRRVEDGIAFNTLSAQVKNLVIDAPEGVLWTEADNRTAFAGELTAEDMGDVLEAWGYARSIETESMLTRAKVSWSGSPLNFELLNLQGDISSGVKTGRFLEVNSGNNALRIFSLLNFTAIAKRMSLNFKDVFGRGISFEKVEAATRLDNGQLTFIQPMRVEGTGGDFKVNGGIDLVAGELDNEMVVTLPVNKSLPWLGAYLALANPMVGIGVLVGERILRKPIKELSSAKYKITGPMDDPQLELVSVFDRSMESPDSEQEATEIEVPDDLPELAGDLEELEGAESASTTEITGEEDGSGAAPAAESSDLAPDPQALPAQTTDFEDFDQKESPQDGSIATSPGS